MAINLRDEAKEGVQKLRSKQNVSAGQQNENGTLAKRVFCTGFTTGKQDRPFEPSQAADSNPSEAMAER